MKMRNPLKIVRALLLLSICTLVVIVLYSIFDHSTYLYPKKNETNSFLDSKPHDRHVIRGLKYTSNINRDVKLSIEADQFHLEKKKIGFFRFGILSEAKLTKAKILLVKNPEQADKDTVRNQTPVFPSELPRSPMDNNTTQNISDDFILDSAKAIFNEIYVSNFLPGVSTKRIFAFKIAPIELQVSEGDLTLMKISAGRASFDMKNKKIVFSENVTVATDKYSWQGKELTVDPISGMVTRTEKHAQGQHTKAPNKSPLPKFNNVEEVGTNWDK